MPTDQELSALFTKALTLLQGGNLGEAGRICDQILAVVPEHPETLHMRGLVDLQQHRFGDAIRRFEAALRLKPDYAHAHTNRGAALIGLGLFKKAVTSVDRALALNPASATSHANRAIALNGLGDAAGALASADKALAINFRDPQALVARIEALTLLGRAEEALKDCDTAAVMLQGSSALHGARAQVLRTLGRLEEALASCDLAIAALSDAAGHNHRAGLLLALDRNEDALAAAGRALALDSSLIAALQTRAEAFSRLNRPADALEAYDQLITRVPQAAETHARRAMTLGHLQRWPEALRATDQALALQPSYPEALLIKASALQVMERHAETVEACTGVLTARPESAQAHLIRGASLISLKREEEALADYEAAVRLDQAGETADVTAIYLSLRISQWANLDRKIAVLRDQLREGRAPSHPFHLLALPLSAREQYDATARYVQRKIAAKSTPVFAAPAGLDKIRLGYFSADFCTHAVAHLVAGLFAAHDKSKFEITGFALGGQDDAMRAEITRSLNRMIDAATLSDAEAAARARAMNIDIAIDLNVHTHRVPAIFAAHAAPLQVNFLGYPGSSGAAFYDYIVGDPIITPLSQAAAYSERLVQLPHTYQPNDHKRYAMLRPVTRAEHGLPAAGFVFCCFNDIYKITPDAFGIWMRLLAAVDGSVLWLLQSAPASMNNLRREAEKHGVDGGRLVFAPRVLMDEHLARHQAADLFLDTFHYNAHTTATDALWAGLPVLTLQGDAFAARVASSLITAAGLPELVTTDAQSYEDLGLALAQAPGLLSGLRTRLIKKRGECPLFDTARYTRNIETAYAEIWRRHLAGAAPDHLVVTEK